MSDTVDTFVTDDGYSVRIVPDDSAWADSPRDWGGCLATLAQLNDRYKQPDEGDDTAAELLRAWKQFRDHAMVERFARMFLGAVAYDTIDTGDHGEGTVIGMIAGTYEDDGETIAIANPGEVLLAELKVYKQWADGDVFGVIVEDPETGNDASLWSVYDEYGDWNYIKSSVVPELISEVKTENAKDEERRIEAYDRWVVEPAQVEGVMVISNLDTGANVAVDTPLHVDTILRQIARLGDE